MYQTDPLSMLLKYSLFPDLTYTFLKKNHFQPIIHISYKFSRQVSIWDFYFLYGEDF